jgi:segregation and condensation protein B
MTERDRLQRVIEVGEPVMDDAGGVPETGQQPEPGARPGTGAPPEPGQPPVPGAPPEPDARPETGAPEPRPQESIALEMSEAQLEALLFVAERPLGRREIAGLAGVDRATVDERLGDLEVSLAARGIRLVLNGDRVELATAPEAGALIARYVGADAIRLSPASLETLAIVAYRQPVTKAVVERIRGVDSDYTIRTLLHRRLVVELGRAESPGRPYLYGTGFEFLERFGLASLEELPPLDADVAARLVDTILDTALDTSLDGEVKGDMAEADRLDEPPS